MEVKGREAGERKHTEVTAEREREGDFQPRQGQIDWLVEITARSDWLPNT